MKNKGLINEYYAVRNKGTLMKEISSSSDRIAGINIIADSIDDFNKKQREILKSVKVIDSVGNDIMRRELLPDIKWFEMKWFEMKYNLLVIELL